MTPISIRRAFDPQLDRALRRPTPAVRSQRMSVLIVGVVFICLWGSLL